MATIVPLTQGKVAMIDDADADLVLGYTWHAIQPRPGKWYAASRDACSRRNVYLHSLLMQPPVGFEVDHQDSDGLNCQRYNMRVCTRGQNCHNRKVQPHSSKHKGVVRVPSGWVANIRLNGIRKYLGHFTSELDAARAYNDAAKRLHGSFARLNDLEA